MAQLSHEVGRVGALLALIVTLGCPVDATARLSVIYNFPGGSNGSIPDGPVTLDSSGNLYGTTYGGGGSCGCGTVFKIKPSGETVLHAFDKTDGEYPSSNLIFDSSGNLYGTTLEGGVGAGTVFKLAPDGTESVLYSFQGGNDGSVPFGDITIDGAGNIYGTTTEGGGGTNCENGASFGCGTVFEIHPDGTKTIMHAFLGGSDDGAGPFGVIFDNSGNLLVITDEGGGSCSLDAYGCGTIFKITPEGSGSILYAFRGGDDGASPVGLAIDGNGNIFGATESGGSTACGGGGCGTVFEIAPDGSETVLYAFQSGDDGAFPHAGVILDKAGNLYGTTEDGGGSRCHGGCGTIFKVSPTGQETILRRLGAKLGENPESQLVLGRHGLLYGTAPFGGAHKYGTVFSIKK